MPSRLSSLLVRDGLVGVRRMEKAFQRQVIYGGSLDTILLELGMIPEERLCQYLALASGLPPASRAEMERIDPDAVLLLARDSAIAHRAMPLVIEGEAVRMAVCSPVDLGALEDLADQIDRPLRPLLVPEYRWHLMLARGYGGSPPQRFAALAAQIETDPASQPVGRSRTVIIENEPERDTIVTTAATDAALASEQPRARRITEDLAQGQPATPTGTGARSQTNQSPPIIPSPPIISQSAATVRPAIHTDTPGSLRRRATLIGLRPVRASTEPHQLELVDDADLSPASGIPTHIASGEVRTAELTPAPTINAASATRRPTGQMFVTPSASTVDAAVAVSLPVPAESDPPPTSSSVRTTAATAVLSVSQPPVARHATVTGADGPRPLGLRPSTSPIQIPGEISAISAREARELMARAEHRDEVFIALLRAVRHVARWAGLLTVHGGAAIGRIALAHADLDVEQIATVLIPLDAASPVRTAMTSKRMYVGPLSKGDPSVDSMFLRMGGLRSPSLAVLPVVLRERVVAMVVGHRGDRDITFADVADLPPLAILASEAIGRLILRSKGETAGPATENTEEPSRKESRRSTAPSEQTSSRSEASTAQDHGAGPYLPYEPAERDPNESLPEIEIQGELGEGPGNQVPDHETAPAAVEATIGPEVAPRTSQPAMTLPYRDPASVPQLATAAIEIEPPSASIQQVPPPLSETGANPAALSIDVLLDLVEDRSSAEFEIAMDEAIARASEVLPVLARRFPGTLDVDRLMVAGRPLRAAQYGGLLELITRLGSITGEMLLEKMGSPARDIRFYATVCVTELRPRDAIPALIERLYDPDVGVRACAIEALQGYPVRDLELGLIRIRQALHSDDSQRVAAAAAAAAALGDGNAVEELIAALDRGDPFVHSSRRALLLLTKQDFGTSARKWQRWWDDHQHRHRVEWMIDGLMHSESALRASAIADLRRFTGETFGYEPELPKQDRETAHRRWLTWWNDTGRLRFVVGDNERHRPSASLPSRRE